MGQPSPREKLFALIQETGATDRQLDGTILIGFMVIAEWRGPNGEQWLSKVSGDHGDSLPSWRQRGYAAEVIYDMWGDQREEEKDSSD